MDYKALIERLNTEFETLLTKKEDVFWRSYMALDEDADATRKELSAAEIALDSWFQDPAHLREVREAVRYIDDSNILLTEDDKLSLAGWLHNFEANVIESPEARRLSQDLVDLESKLAKARGEMKLGYQIPGSDFQTASSVKLSGMIRTEPSEEKRKAAWEGLRSIEKHVLENGYLDVVKARNKLSRMLGAEDYYDWKTRNVEGMKKTEVFELLSELEALTRDRAERSLTELKKKYGPTVTPWNISYLISGDVTREMDPYFPFANSIDVWGRSFQGLGADFQGATLKLDLLDRKGKYENGFCHFPVPAWRRNGVHRPGRIQFTATAIPSLVGAGQRSLETLFHEGGHAIHHANIDMPSPCYSHEFAPSSVAFDEIQSMLVDSLIGDADWLSLYARTKDNDRIPFSLIEKSIESKQPFAAWSVRAMLVVPFAERAIYEIPDDELSAERVLEVCRETERKLLHLDGSPRPVLSVPHLLSGNSSAYYHGYIMAEMGVHQTRKFLIERDGFLTDNPKVFPSMREKFWVPGNRYRIHEYMQRMTGERLSPRAIAAKVNREVREAKATAKASYQRVQGKQGYAGKVDMNAAVSVVHGNEIIGEIGGKGDFEGLGRGFREWILGKL